MRYRRKAEVGFVSHREKRSEQVEVRSHGDVEQNVQKAASLCSGNKTRGQSRAQRP
jgi:hypothetical protein